MIAAVFWFLLARLWRFETTNVRVLGEWLWLPEPFDVASRRLAEALQQNAPMIAYRPPPRLTRVELNPQQVIYMEQRR